VDQARARLDAARPRSTAVDSVMRTIERDVAAGGGVLAGALAFRIFMFMVPFVFLLVGVFGLGSSAANKDPNAGYDAASPGSRRAPRASAISFGERVVYGRGRIATYPRPAPVKVLRIVHALIWHTRAGKVARSGMAVLALIGIVALGITLSALIGVLRGESFLLGLAGTIIYVFIPVVLWTLVSWHLPHADLPWTALVPGAVVFGVGLELMHLVTVYWIAREVESKTSTYGAIGFAIALVLWAYLVGRLITTAAVVNESLWTRHQEQIAHRHQRQGPPTRRSGPEGPLQSDVGGSGAD
jgi:uncharacterized BrkB/YihY/UPF0761 family membrane protein